ncbi:DUF3291 domain-containing protein [Streptomyces griseorubiginosus]|uniref:DUF3291 domain-containing protein n=1 Tax=Streptomyces griseorubiginosus TaxID=67304 RepID=UPI0036760D13
MPHLALYTFGVLKSPLADPAPLTREFHDSAGPVYQQIAHHPGYLAHAEVAEGGTGSHFDLDWGVWGEFVVPNWYSKGRTVEDIALAATLSLWTDLRSAHDAVYGGLHRAALNRRHDWFDRTGHPSHVFWWLPDEVTPTWQDGVSRLEHLHEHGSAPHGFAYPHAFAPDGTPGGNKGSGPQPVPPAA